MEYKCILISPRELTEDEIKNKNIDSIIIYSPKKPSHMPAESIFINSQIQYNRQIMENYFSFIKLFPPEGNIPAYIQIVELDEENNLEEILFKEPLNMPILIEATIKHPEINYKLYKFK